MVREALKGENPLPFLFAIGGLPRVGWGGTSPLFLRPVQAHVSTPLRSHTPSRDPGAPRLRCKGQPSLSLRVSVSVSVSLSPRPCSCQARAGDTDGSGITEAERHRLTCPHRQADVSRLPRLRGREQPASQGHRNAAWPAVVDVCRGCRGWWVASLRPLAISWARGPGGGQTVSCQLPTARARAAAHLPDRPHSLRTFEGPQERENGCGVTHEGSRGHRSRHSPGNCVGQ